MSTGERKSAIGLDIGTTHIKACLTDENGIVLAVSETDNEMKETAGFGKCFVPEELFDKAVSCIRQVAKSGVCAIGITSMAEAGVFLDETGRPVLPVIPWNGDGGECLLPEDLRGEALYNRTGLIWHPKYTVNRILDLRRKRPELYRKICCFLSVSDYILYRLTGVMATDESLACRTGMYDIQYREYWKEMLEFSGMEGKLPQVIRERKAWPVLPPETANELGLSGRVTVRVCGHDHLCAAYGERLEYGEILNSMGTSEVYTGWLEDLKLNRDFYERGIQQGRFGDHCYWMCNMPSSGASVEWFRGLLSMKNAGKISYTELLEEKGQHPSPVFYFPFINGVGTHRNPALKEMGGFLGIRPETGRGDMLQGIYEGIAMESRWILERLEEMGIRTEIIRAVGGGTKNKGLLKAKADVAGRSFHVSSLTQATAAGAAMLAGDFRGGGTRKETAVLPEEMLREAYEEKYRMYQKRIAEWR